MPYCCWRAATVRQSVPVRTATDTPFVRIACSLTCVAARGLCAVVPAGPFSLFRSRRASIVPTQHTAYCSHNRRKWFL